MKEKSVAILTIKDANKMSIKEKKEISDWLRVQAKDFSNPKYEYAHQYRARYLYPVT